MSVKTIKSDISSLRHAHNLKLAELKASIDHTSRRILAAVSAFSRSTSTQQGGGGGKTGGAVSFRKERLELSGMEEGYNRCCESTFKDLE